MDKYLTFSTRKDFRRWLNEHGSTSDGVWLCFDKSKKQTTLKADEALEEALCFGWIDGQMKSIEDDYYLKYFSIRRKNSKWSEKNKLLVAELDKKGIMEDMGRAKIQEAKENGQWDVNNTIIVDNHEFEELLNNINGIEPAYTNFLAMSMSVKKTYVKAFKAPKTIEGKEKRLAWIIDRLNKNLKPM